MKQDKLPVPEKGILRVMASIHSYASSPSVALFFDAMRLLHFCYHLYAKYACHFYIKVKNATAYFTIPLNVTQ